MRIFHAKRLRCFASTGRPRDDSVFCFFIRSPRRSGVDSRRSIDEPVDRVRRPVAERSDPGGRRPSGVVVVPSCFSLMFFFSSRRVHEVVEESRHGRPARHRPTGQVGLGGVGRRQDGAGRGPGPAGRLPGGHRCGPAVRHARAPATGRPMPARHPVLPDDHHRQGQRDDGFQGRGDGRR